MHPITYPKVPQAPGSSLGLVSCIHLSASPHAATPSVPPPWWKSAEAAQAKFHGHALPLPSVSSHASTPVVLTSTWNPTLLTSVPEAIRHPRLPCHYLTLTLGQRQCTSICLPSPGPLQKGPFLTRGYQRESLQCYIPSNLGQNPAKPHPRKARTL